MSQKSFNGRYEQQNRPRDKSETYHSEQKNTAHAQIKILLQKRDPLLLYLECWYLFCNCFHTLNESCHEEKEQNEITPRSDFFR